MGERAMVLYQNGRIAGVLRQNRLTPSNAGLPVGVRQLLEEGIAIARPRWLSWCVRLRTQ